MDAAFSAEPYLPTGVPQLKLRPEAVLMAADVDAQLIPNVSADHIREKSKANSLAKTIVCLQASWFCVQCIGRLRQGFGVSLLEFNTFAHAICTLLIILLWWNKPLDVDQAAVIHGEQNSEFCAAMVMTDALESKAPRIALRDYKHRYRGHGARHYHPTKSRSRYPRHC